MLVKAILLGFVGVIGVMDSRLLGRSNLEQPLVMSCLVGLALGDLTKGLIVGASLELVFMGMANIGAAAPPDLVLGSVIATAFAILSHTNAQTALTIALPVAILGQMLAIVVRMFISTFNRWAKTAIDEGKFAKARHYHILWGSLLYAGLYFILVFLSVYLGTDLVKNVVAMIPKWVTDALTLASKILPAFGFALLMQTMLTKKTMVYLLLGFFITAYAKMSVTGVAIFAVLLVLVLNEVLPKKQTAHTEQTADDDLEEL
ncbi:PTS sugar transporter subunit IIC [Bombilactobacillus folatiphilus]|uniref:PTS sugar transporter subunit IIC n=1 Tax=Bombilactobacillus folatiphilus TaxID=2923362 RepID=A0ABY4P9B0_9LACO|nr:PTS sugar transporter subunit IIC [Bombilactobacillus folatiphilus]UQS82268.1 PTS sugar transporter subunit IIC [Bombilactobacillus folatiphilus]